MSQLDPPKNDELIDRQQFYARVANASNNNEKDITGVGRKLSDFVTTFEQVKDDVKTASIRNKTLITAALVVWTLLGSGITMYVQRGLATFDRASEQIATMEKKITLLETYNEQHKDIPEKVAALKGNLLDLQRKVDDHDRIGVNK